MWIGLEPPNIAGGVIIGEPVNYKEWYLDHASFCDGEENRRWKLEDWMIKNYQDYEALLISEGGEVALQQMGKELNEEEIAKAVAIKNYLASLTPEEVAGFMPEPVPVMAKEAVIEVEEESDGILAIHRLKKDETWTHLALQYYGHMSEPYWRLIYEANIDLVGEDYHCIWGGMELVVPILPPGFSP
jgi:nucleoid-associated protein YgaU